MQNESNAGLNHVNARTEEQKVLMAKIETDGVCPFCATHFIKYHPKPILKETDYWFVTENMSPYEGTKFHFLFVYKPSHVTRPTDITPLASQDLFSLLAWIIESYKIEGGSFFMRFGDMQYNGSSVSHLHAQLIVGKKYEEGDEALRVKLGWKALL
jgi:diadenosine tetraphosphate (Ap4A) HIT family hydrolase